MERYHLWQVDGGEKLPLGKPKLMTSLTIANQFEFEKVVGERDASFETDWKRKRGLREGIREPSVHPDADYIWKN